ncbi:MAG: ATP-binding protein [Prevotellaceae bacterium]|jgi:predicted AAA+ superfamily ATPase|nr:ATP-binding protein [Prevotellaceae bacterium]
MGNKFEQIIAEQKEERNALPVTDWCSRADESKIDLDSPLAQIVIGVRRSGKSTICHKVLKNRNIDYAYVNFDDERLHDLRSEQLNDVLQALYTIYGDFKYLFLDEIQNVEGWHLFVNRLLRQGIRLIVIGSNAKLLSGELSTHLTGRYVEIELFPFSFSETLNYKKINHKASTTKEVAFRRQAYLDYLKQGGFPEMFRVGEGQKREYLRTLFQSIIFKDIVKRFTVRYIKTLTDIFNILLNNISREISYTKIAKMLNIRSVHTAQNYVSYLKQAYLFLSVPRFSYKSIARASNRKMYVIDSAFLSFLPEITSSNDGFLLENIVLLELCRRRANNNFDIYYYKNNYEIDFVIAKNGNIQELIQVSLALNNEKRRKREISALLKAADDLKCNNLKIITQEEKNIIVQNGQTIEIISVIDWLCDGNNTLNIF